MQRFFCYLLDDLRLRRDPTQPGAFMPHMGPARLARQSNLSGSNMKIKEHYQSRLTWSIEYDLNEETNVPSLMQQCMREWNDDLATTDVKLRFTVEPVRLGAFFRLRHARDDEEKDPENRNCPLYSFTPNAWQHGQAEMVFFKRFFDDVHPVGQANLIRHELGHIIGLTHDHIIQPQLNTANSAGSYRSFTEFLALPRRDAADEEVNELLTIWKSQCTPIQFPALMNFSSIQTSAVEWEDRSIEDPEEGATPLAVHVPITDIDLKVVRELYRGDAIEYPL